MARLHVSEGDCPGGEVNVLNMQIGQGRSTAAGAQKKVDDDPIAVFCKRTGLEAGAFQQTFQLGSSIGLFQRFIRQHQLDGKTRQIVVVHTPVQKGAHHAQMGVQCSIADGSLPFRIKDIVIYRIFCDRINGQGSVSEKQEKLSCL